MNTLVSEEPPSPNPELPLSNLTRAAEGRGILFPAGFSGLDYQQTGHIAFHCPPFSGLPHLWRSSS